MRVIGGREKGRRLAGPRSEKIRPALDKVKQAVFNILGEIEGKRVLDLFAGTGSIGIEALSRGAAYCTFVDSSREAILLIRKNLVLCRFEDSSKILKIHLPSRIFRLHPPTPSDLIFIDPPYDRDLVNPTLRAVAREKILAPGGTVIVEHSPREIIEEVADLTLFDQRKYGQTFISFLKG